MYMHHTKGRNVAHRLVFSSTRPDADHFYPTPQAGEMIAAATPTQKRTRGRPEAVVLLAQ